MKDILPCIIDDFDQDGNALGFTFVKVNHTVGDPSCMVLPDGYKMPKTACLA